MRNPKKKYDLGSNALNQRNGAAEHPRAANLQWVDQSEDDQLSSTEIEDLDRAIDVDNHRDRRQALREQDKRPTSERQFPCLCFNNPGRKCDPACPYHGQHAPGSDLLVFAPTVVTTDLQLSLGLDPILGVEGGYTYVFTRAECKLLLLILALVATSPLILISKTLRKRVQDLFNHLGKPHALLMRDSAVPIRSFPESKIQLQLRISKQMKKARAAWDRHHKALWPTTEGAN